MSAHNFRYDSDARCNICTHCGASDWKGFWLAGVHSETEPPCAVSGEVFEQWKMAAQDSAKNEVLICR